MQKTNQQRRRQEFFLGLDLGTTTLKACVIRGGSGSVVAQASRPLPVRMLAGGGREQSPRRILQTLRTVLREVRESAGDVWLRVAGVGLSAQGGSTNIVERETGRPLTPMFLWNDLRGSAFMGRVYEQFPPAYWRRQVLCDSAPAGLGRLLWLKERAPELFVDSNIHVGAGDFLFHALTGEWRQEAGSAIQIGPYNAATHALDAGPLALLDLPLSFFPRLRNGHETAPLNAAGSRLLGLSAGVPVAGPYLDQEAGYLSAHAAAPRPLQVSLGTAWVGNFALPPGRRSETALQLVLPSPLGAGRFVVLPARTGNAAWDWALAEFAGAGADPLKVAARIFQHRLLPPDGLCAIPWLGQANPHCDAFGGGVVWGLGTHTPTAELVRAVAAGMVYEFRRLLDPLCDRDAIDAVVLSGGAAKGAWFRTLFSALFAPLPVFWQTDSDIGAARGSLHAFGAAAHGRLRRVPAISPDLAAAVQAQYAQYLQYFGATYGMLPAGQPLRIVAVPRLP